MEKSGYPQEPQAGYPPPYYPQGQGPPQQSGFVHNQGAHMQQPTVVQVIQMPSLGSESTRMSCPHCGAEVSTKVTYQTSCMTHVAAALLCLFGLWCCVCIPYCTDSCMDADHECPNCHKFLGQYRR